jgi:hypothetical protein
MLEADGSDHDDGFSVFPDETSTLALLRDQAYAMNTLIAPVVTLFSADGTGGASLQWSPVVGNPDYDILASSNLLTWSLAARVSTNAWTDPGGPATRFYRIRPSWGE